MQQEALMRSDTGLSNGSGVSQATGDQAVLMQSPAATATATAYSDADAMSLAWLVCVVVAVHTVRFPRLNQSLLT